jgi:hypothetical protein
MQESPFCGRSYSALSEFYAVFQGKGAFLIWEFSTSVTFQSVVPVNIKVMWHDTV